MRTIKTVLKLFGIIGMILFWVIIAIVAICAAIWPVFLILKLL